MNCSVCYLQVSRRPLVTDSLVGCPVEFVRRTDDSTRTYSVPHTGDDMNELLRKQQTAPTSAYGAHHAGGSARQKRPSTGAMPMTARESLEALFARERGSSSHLDMTMQNMRQAEDGMLVAPPVAPSLLHSSAHPAASSTTQRRGHPDVSRQPNGHAEESSTYMQDSAQTVIEGECLEHMPRKISEHTHGGDTAYDPLHTGADAGFTAPDIRILKSQLHRDFT